VTDQGFLNEHNVIWETLDDVAGNSQFIGADFKVTPPKPVPTECGAETSRHSVSNSTQQQQLDSEYCVFQLESFNHDYVSSYP